MRSEALLFSLLGLLLAGPAGAAVLETWTRSSLQFTNLGRAEAVTTASGLATVTTSSSTSSHLSTLRSRFDAELSLVASVPLTDPRSAPLSSAMLAVRPRGGVFAGISGAIASSAAGILPNTAPSTGAVTLCLLVAPLPPCVAQLTLSVGATSGGVPGLGIGVGGILLLGGTGSITISLVGAPYTVKTVSAVNRTANGGFDLFVEAGFAHGPVSLTSSTAAPSGVLQVVTATHTVTMGLGYDLSGSISRTVTHFVPEPARVLLFGSGAALMALLGRSRAGDRGGGAGARPKRAGQPRPRRVPRAGARE